MKVSKSLRKFNIDAPPLSATDEMCDVFPDPPMKMCLHIVVRAPPLGECEWLIPAPMTVPHQPSRLRFHFPSRFLSGTKRASSEALAEELLHQSKRTKLATTAPSETGEPQAYRRLQRDPLERILDDRPIPDADMPPISLL